MKISIILLFLLKMIGIVLLVILAVVILLLLILLLTPIHYKLLGEKFENIKGFFYVSWFFRLLQLKGEFTDSLRFQLKLFGKPIMGDGVKPKKDKKSKKKRKKEKEEATEPIHTVYPIEDEVAISMRSSTRSREEIPPTANLPIEENIPRRVRMEDILEEAPPPSDVEDELPDDFFTINTEKTQNKNIAKYYEQFKAIPDKKAVIKAAILLIKRLLKGVLPNSFYFKGTVGTGDPASTGYLCGLLGVLKMKLGNHLEIIPDFKDMTVRDIKISIKGKIVPGYFVYIILRFLLSKPIWHIVKLYWKGKR